MWIVDKIWSGPMALPVTLGLVCLLILFGICVCCVFNVPGFKPKLDFGKDKLVRAVPANAQYRAPITREGDVVRTTSLPARGAREISQTQELPAIVDIRDRRTSGG